MFLARRREPRQVQRLRQDINAGVARLRDALVEVQRLEQRAAPLIAAVDPPLTDAQRAPVLDVDARRRALDQRRARLQLFCAPADGPEAYGLERDLRRPEPEEGPERDRWHALQVWGERLRTEEADALAEICEAVRHAVDEADTLAADAHTLYEPIVRVASDEHAWRMEMGRLDRLQRAHIDADDLLR